VKVSSWSIAVLAAIFTAGFTELAIALYNVQVVNVAEFKRDLNLQATRRVRKPGIRGRILDARGGVLAESRARRDIVCDLAAFRKNGSISNTVAAVEADIVRLAGALGVDRPEHLTARRIVRHIRTASAIPMCVWRDLDESTLARFEERAAAFEGFSVESHAERHYPRGSFAAHLIGYTGRDRSTDNPDEAYMLAYELEMKGRSGLEKFYDGYLAGVAGAVRIPDDARGFKPLESARDNITIEEKPERDAQDGLDLHLTLDPDIQAAAESQFKGVRGACVVLDPRDGAVLAMVSAPSFDLNDFVPFLSEEKYKKLSEDPGRPLLNRATAGLYIPGSTFKPVTAIAALNSGFKANDDYECTGVYKLGSMRLRCWSRWGQGHLNMRGAIEQSCNPYFARLGYLMGTNTLFKTAREFGFAAKTGIDFAPDLAGALVSPPFYPGLPSQTAIGQGRLQVTPLQVAMECAALANGGKVYAPYLKKRPAGSPPPEPLRKLTCSAESIETVRRGMRDVVEGIRGTGKALGGLNVPCAGKTGTAQTGNGSKDTWVIAFAPYDNPTVAVALVVEQGDSGGKTAAPRVHNILASIFGEKREDR
jgi:penicillin-binding protein 2